MSQGLPRHLRILRDRIITAKNALDALERFEFASEWGATYSEEKKRNAMNNVERAVLAAADAIGVHPSEAMAYRDIITRLQDENRRLTAANVDLLHGRAA
jgi:adenylosuccinate lyase